MTTRDKIKKTIRGQLNKHKTNPGLFGGYLILTNDADKFINDLTEILLRRLDETALSELDLKTIIFGVLRANRNRESMYELAELIAREIESHT